MTNLPTIIHITAQNKMPLVNVIQAPNTIKYTKCSGVMLTKKSLQFYAPLEHIDWSLHMPMTSKKKVICRVHRYEEKFNINIVMAFTYVFQYTD